MKSCRRVVIVAGGLSVTPEAIAEVRALKLRTIVINDSYRIMPDAEALFAADAAWWQANPQAESFAGEKYVSEDQRIETAVYVPPEPPKAGGNSALRAVHLAFRQGAETVYLLGVDLRDDEQTHWHGRHEHPSLHNPNESTFRRARKAWIDYSVRTDRPEIINCNPRSAVECFPRMTLAEAFETAHA